MKLVNLTLNNFRKYEVAEIDFPEGLTGIVGANGAGKSSLMEAIAWTLYGNAAARTPKEQIKKQNSSSSKICQATLEFEISNDHYQVVREMRGTNLSTDAAVHVNKKPAARGAKAALEYITKTLGMDREAFFTSFFAKQKELNALSDLKPAERKNLIIRMLGIDGVDKAIELLKLDVRDVATRTEALRESVLDENTLQVNLEKGFKEKEVAKTTLTQKKEERDNLEIELRDFKDSFKKEREKRDEYTELLQDYKIKQNELKNAQENLDKYLDEKETLLKKKAQLKKIEPHVTEYERVKKTLEQMVRLEGEQNLVNELNDRKKNLQEELGKLKEGLKIFKNNSDKLEENTNSINEIKQMLKQEEISLEKTKEKLHSSKTSLAHLEDELGKTKKQKEGVTKLGPESKCPTCLRPLSKDLPSIEKHFLEKIANLEERISELNKTSKNLEKSCEDKTDGLRLLKEKKESLEKEKTNLELKTKEASHLKQKIEQVRKSLDETGEKLKKIGNFVYDERGHQDLKEKLSELEKKHNTAIQFETDIKRLPKIEAEITALTQKKNALEKESDEIIEAGRSLSFSEDNYQKIQKDFEKARERKHEVEIKLKEIEHKCKIIDMEIEKIEKDIGQNKERQKEIKELMEKRTYLEELKKIFSNFRKHLIGKIRPALSQKASDLFQELTEGKYTKVELDENYELQVYDNGEKFPIERYSGGEKDLANLCLRIAISQLMTEGNGQGSGFIALDEIFGSQDNLRQANIMRALAKLANQFSQIFIITHVDGLKDSLEHVINVWEDEEGTSQARLE